MSRKATAEDWVYALNRVADDLDQIALAALIVVLIGLAASLFNA